MVRGVSRQIIEVNETQSAYFERALFFVHPQYSDAQRDLLEKEARRMLRTMGVPTRAQKRARRYYLWVRMAGCAVLGALAALAIAALVC